MYVQQRATCVRSIPGNECCFYGKLTQWVNIHMLSFKLLKALGPKWVRGDGGGAILESCIKNEINKIVLKDKNRYWFYLRPTFSLCTFIFHCGFYAIFKIYVLKPGVGIHWSGKKRQLCLNVNILSLLFNICMRAMHAPFSCCTPGEPIGRKLQQ